MLPGLVLLLAWAALSDTIITSRVVDSLPEALRNQPEAQLSLTLNDIRNLAAGQMVDESRRAEFAVAAELYYGAAHRVAEDPVRPDHRGVVRRVCRGLEPAAPAVPRPQSRGDWRSRWR